MGILCAAPWSAAIKAPRIAAFLCLSPRDFQSVEAASCRWTGSERARRSRSTSGGNREIFTTADARGTTEKVRGLGKIFTENEGYSKNLGNKGFPCIRFFLGVPLLLLKILFRLIPYKTRPLPFKIGERVRFFVKRSNKATLTFEF